MIDKNLLYGTWRLVKGVSKDGADNLLPPPYGGAEAMALLSLRRDGRMISVLCDSRASIPSGEERDYTSYCGKYEFDGYTLTTRVDACSDPARFGTDQVRQVRMDGNLLVLQPPPREKNGKTEHREMFWEKIAEV
jgi:hypothetical protein